MSTARGNLVKTTRKAPKSKNTLLKKVEKSRDAISVLDEILGESFSFAMLLRAYRTREDLSQGQLAKKLGVGTSYISDLENKRKRASVEQAKEFAKRLGQNKKLFIQTALQDLLSDANVDMIVELKMA